MNILKAVLFAIVAVFSLNSAQASSANFCPDMFLTHLTNFNTHLALEKQGISGIYQEDADYITQEVANHPEVVNCSDEYLGDNPLAYSFHTLFNLCTLPEAADFLIAHGASIDQEDHSMFNTPLYYAVEAYGSIYGTPDPIILRNDFCSDDIAKDRFQATIKSLIQKGARVNHVGHYGDSIQKVARDLKVTDVLRQ